MKLLLRNLLLLFTSMVICLTLVLAGCSPKIYNLSSSVAPNGSGTISPSGGPFQGKVTLIATPAQYYEFSGWAGAASGTTNPLTVTMNSDKQIVAQFTRVKSTIQVISNPPDGGIVHPASGAYDAGSTINVTATPASGYRFDKWTGSLSSKSNPLNLIVDNGKSLIANFIKTWNLSVNQNPIGSGTVNPSGTTYDDGTKLVLTAVANFPYIFDHWAGTNSDDNNFGSLVMNSDTFITAYFTKETAGTQQTKTGVYNGWDIPIQFQLNVGQWVEIGFSSTQYNIPVRFLDPNSTVLKDFGWTTAGSFNLQSQTSGTYTIDIKGSSTLTNPGYTVTYTIYSR